MNRRNTKIFFAITLSLCLLSAGCSRRQENPKPPPPEVSVATVEPQTIVLTTELPGLTSAYRVAEIRPQVSGLIQKRLFTEGAEVKAGELLYQIDPAPFLAALDTANANLGTAKENADRARAEMAMNIAALKRHQATLELAQLNNRRYEQLFKEHAVSAMDHDQSAADVKVAEAALKTAEAQVESSQQAVEMADAAIKQAGAAIETAQINLNYTKITAPISGRIGRSNLTEGAIATAYQQTFLATIHQLDPIFVDVPQSTVELSRLRRSLANGRLKEKGTNKIKIILEDGTAYPQEGSLEFRDVTVDPTTWSITLRIVVPNPDVILLPHMYVRAVIEEGVMESAILIPQQSLQRDFKGNPFVWTVDAQGKVEQRQITADREYGNQCLVASGLASGDRVIVEGIQKVQQLPPGTAVKTVPFEAEGNPAAKVESKPAAAPLSK